MRATPPGGGRSSRLESAVNVRFNGANQLQMLDLSSMLAIFSEMFDRCEERIDL